MFDVIIVGGGPSGLTAAIYAKRAGKSVLVLEKESFGGQIATSPRVENFPTIKSISGTELIDRLLDQVLDLGVDVDVDEVKHIEKNNGIFDVECEYSSYQAKAVILATGCSPRSLDTEGLEEYIGKGVSYCAVCDGSFYEGKDVCLIGDANTALQYALLLSNLCNKVYVCTLFDKFFGEDLLVKSLLDRKNVEVTHNILLKKVNGDGQVEQAVFENTQTKEEISFNVDGIFIAIGQIPHNDPFANLVDLDKNGYIIATNDIYTKTEGLFVSGDARQKNLRQLTTAVGDGALAATAAVKYIDSL